MSTTGDISADGAVDGAAAPGELRRRQIDTNVNDESDNGSEEPVTPTAPTKPRKTYGRTNDGTGK